jgi:hypothetical protein
MVTLRVQSLPGHNLHLHSGEQVRSQIALGAISEIPSPPKSPV